MIWHHRIFWSRFFCVIAVAILGACVSVNLPKSNGKRASDVSYETPTEPFHSLGTTSADQAWLNEKNGNTISFLSDCGGKVDPTLEQLQSESLNTLVGMKVLEQKRIDYNARQALVATAEGEVDGVPVKTKLLTLKKNECNYSLTYTGVPKSFGSDLQTFDRFVQSFKAP